MEYFEYVYRVISFSIRTIYVYLTRALIEILELKFRSTIFCFIRGITSRLNSLILIYVYSVEAKKKEKEKKVQLEDKTKINHLTKQHISC